VLRAVPVAEMNRLHCRIVLFLSIQQPSKAVAAVGCQSVTLAELFVENSVGFFEIAKSLVVVFLPNANIAKCVQGVGESSPIEHSIRGRFHDGWTYLNPLILSFILRLCRRSSSAS